MANVFGNFFLYFRDEFENQQFLEDLYDDEKTDGLNKEVVQALRKMQTQSLKKVNPVPHGKKQHVNEAPGTSAKLGTVDASQEQIDALPNEEQANLAEEQIRTQEDGMHTESPTTPATEGGAPAARGPPTHHRHGKGCSMAIRLINTIEP